MIPADRKTAPIKPHVLDPPRQMTSPDENRARTGTEGNLTLGVVSGQQGTPQTDQPGKGSHRIATRDHVLHGPHHWQAADVTVSAHTELKPGGRVQK